MPNLEVFVIQLYGDVFSLHFDFCFFFFCELEGINNETKAEGGKKLKSKTFISSQQRFRRGKKGEAKQTAKEVQTALENEEMLNCHGKSPK